MGKGFLVLIVAAALGYAAYLTLRQRPLRVTVRRGSGWRAQAARLFVLTTAILMGCSHGANNQTADDRNSDPNDSRQTVLCYAPLPAVVVEQPNLLAGLRLAWRTLNTEDLPDENGYDAASQRFGQELLAATKAGVLTEATAADLHLLHEQMSNDVLMSDGTMSCYYSGPTREGQTANELRQQLQLLREAAAAGALTPQTVQTAETAIARKLETLRILTAQAMRGKRFGTPPGEDKIPVVSASAHQTAQFILKLEEADLSLFEGGASAPDAGKAGAGAIPAVPAGRKTK